MKLYSDFFSLKTTFIKDYYTYTSFWSEVCAQKVSDEKYQVVECNSPHDLVKYFAIIASGKVAIMIDPSLPQKQRDELLTSFNINFENALNYDFKEKEVVLSNTSTIIFTSGSSGKPKPIELTHFNFLTSAKQTIEHYQMNINDCWGMTLPFFHIGGLMIIYRTILAKAKTVFCDPKNIASSLDMNPEITILSLIDLQLQKLLTDEYSCDRLKKLKGVVLGGAKTSLHTLQKSVALGIKLSNSYGQTETCSQICATPFTTDLKLLETVGSPLGNTKIRFNDKNIIEISGETIAHGIFSKENFNGTIITSDIGKFDIHNNLTVFGRADDIYISGGKNISPHSIDHEIQQSMKGITSSKTVAVTDSRLGQVGVSFIEAVEVLSHREVLHKIKENLPKYHEPKLLIQSKSFDSIKAGIKIPRKELESLGSSLYEVKEILGNPLIRGDLSKDILLVFHGFMGSDKDFEFLIPELEEDFLLIFVNLPGHNGEGLHLYSDFNDYISKLSEAVTKLSYKKKINALGYSLGGRVASLLAMNNNTIKKLILESSGLGIPNEEKLDRAERDEKLFNGVTTNEELNLFLKNWYQQTIFTGIENSPKFETLINKDTKYIEGWKYSLQLMGQSKMPAISPRVLTENTEKTIYLYGVNDHKYKLIADQFDIAIPVENASHNIHDTNRNKYLRSIRNILLK
ncbi:alpha/beta fold hydrolase [Bacteriovorax sp. Seq25_V]|uniref:alpha/beta fold hydrolase n=1 Tax=Bacteriovorax sp. Seq25_V TaxID=1201288 RepID=UPI000389FF07|nr:alpha/beta fold hydrolase [Bacteriovorax sp. Seq25_V]EQC44405.1 putative 2-succinyl-6-hydroxy-2,4-cyclohexadiene-1-carboxylate synthase [Bacteriovorax sp. Seq25_V]